MQMTENRKTNLPLDKNRLFQSDDLDEAREIVAAKFCDHRLDRVGHSDHFNAVHNRAEGKATSLNYIQYGADVLIDPGELGSFYLIQIPLTGEARVNNSAGEVETGPGLGSVLNPHRHTTMRWREGCSQLLLQVDASHLQRVAERLTGRAIASPVTFETAVDQRSKDVRGWVRKLNTCFDLADKDVVYGRGSALTQVLVEEQLVEEFLRCQPSDISGLIEGAAFRSTNVHVRRAVQHIHAHFADPITIGDIAKSLEITPRSLQMGFQSELGKTPLEYLREIRLREARRLLQTAAPSGRVGDICVHAGFGHFGRFSVQYRQRFGESPHETLARQS